MRDVVTEAPALTRNTSRSFCESSLVLTRNHATVFAPPLRSFCGCPVSSLCILEQVQSLLGGRAPVRTHRWTDPFPGATDGPGCAKKDSHRRVLYIRPSAKFSAHSKLSTHAAFLYVSTRDADNHARVGAFELGTRYRLIRRVLF